MTSCASSNEWLRLIDGQLVEERAAALRAHAAGCAQCASRLASAEQVVRRIAAPMFGLAPVVTDDVRRRVMNRIVATPMPAPPAPASWLKWLAWGGVVSAVASAMLILRPPAPELMARGNATDHSLSREAGASLFTGDATPRRLAAGQTIRPETPLVTTVRNISAQPVYLLQLAVDSRGTVHWIQPAPNAPAAVRVAPHSADLPLPETVVLDEPALGPLRAVTILSPLPVAPSAIGTELSLTALSSRFPGAVVEEIPLMVAP